MSALLTYDVGGLARPVRTGRSICESSFSSLMSMLVVVTVREEFVDDKLSSTNQ